MKIEKKSDEVVYITINGKTVYIDDSTGELVVSAWDAETHANKIIHIIPHLSR